MTHFTADICRKVLKRTRPYLLENVSIKSLSDHLLKEDAFTYDDYDRIHLEKNTQTDSIRILIGILDTRVDALYKPFLDALSDTSQDFIYIELMKEKFLLVIENDVRKNYTQQKDAEVDVEVFYKHIPQDERDFEYVTDDHISNSVTQIHNQIVFDSTNRKFINLTRINDAMSDTRVNRRALPDLTTWSTADVGNWLQLIDNIDPSIVTAFKEQLINGEALSRLNASYLDKIVPGILVGQQMNILGRLEEQLLRNAKSNFVLPQINKETISSCPKDDISENVAPVSLRENEEDIGIKFEATDVCNKEVFNKPPENVAPVSLRENEEDVCIKFEATDICNKEVFNKPLENEVTSAFPIIDEDVANNQTTLSDTCDVNSQLQMFSTVNNQNLNQVQVAAIPKNEAGTVHSSNYLAQDHTYFAPDDTQNSKGNAAIGVKAYKYYPNINLHPKASDRELAKHLVQFTSACLNDKIPGKLIIGKASDGKITGTKLHRKLTEYDEFVKQEVRKAFHNQYSSVIKCVQPIVFTPVGSPRNKTFLCEINIHPVEDICKSQVFYAKFVKPTGKKSKKMCYTFIDERPAAFENQDIKRSVADLEQTKDHRESFIEAAVQSNNEIESESTLVKEIETDAGIDTSSNDNLNLEDETKRNRMSDADVDFKIKDSGESDVVIKCEDDRRGMNSSSTSSIIATQEGLCKKLDDLLCLGDKLIVSDLYPILVTNGLSETLSENELQELQEKLSFIGKVPWKVVFDFGSEIKLCDIFQENSKSDVKIEPTTHMFNRKYANLDNPDKLKNLQSEIESSLKKHFSESNEAPYWIFANGYAVDSDNYPKLDAKKWNKEQRLGFKEAISLYNNYIPNGRAIVVTLALSEDTSVLTEALSEIITTFEDQWISLIPQNTSIAEEINTRLMPHFDQKDIEERTVCGISWGNTNKVFSEIYSHNILGLCKLPTSSDEYVTLDQTTRNRLSDLDVLSANECEEYGKFADRLEMQNEMQQEEIKYYTGAEVSWLNFKAETHVCERDIKRQLQSHVQYSLQPKIPEDTFTGRVWLYHQPGAGGTTVAKHVLWDLRHEYRCVVVKNVTDHTVNNLLLLRKFQDANPKPILVLLDNIDEELANVLVTDMEEKSKKHMREIRPEHRSPVCVFLICLRKSQLPVNSSMHSQYIRCSLAHQLSLREKRWWRDKYNLMECQNRQKANTDKTKINPMLLISFNIMKHNFDEMAIRRMTENIMAQITPEKELILLKYVALLNAFDVCFRSIPSSTFDELMIPLSLDRQSQKKKKKHRNSESSRIIYHSSGGPSGMFRNKSSQIKSWISRLSPEFRILMNDPSPYSCRSVTNLRLTNVLLCQHILHIFQEQNMETTSAMVLQFLQSNEIFNVQGIARTKIVETTVDILRRRERGISGLPEAKFAPMIQYIFENEEVADACIVLEKIFAISLDPFIAQHIARINIESRNWKRAFEFAKKATDILPGSAILWDTWGRIYKQQLVDELKNLSASGSDIAHNKIIQIINTAQKGVEYFREGQMHTQKSQNLYGNQAVYIGELELVQLLLICLGKFPCFKQKENLTRCLVNENYYPIELKECNIVGQDATGVIEALTTLKEMIRGVDCTLRILEDERIQLKPANYVDDYRTKGDRANVWRIESVKANLYEYLREDIQITKDMNQEEKVRHYRRKIKNLGGNSFLSIQDLRYEENGDEKLLEIKAMCLEIINSGCATAEDYEHAIQICLALVQFDDKYIRQIRYTDVAIWSEILYQKRQTLIGRNKHLEPYLFHVMFNWPRCDSSGRYIPQTKLKSALLNWKSAYFEKHPRQGHSYKRCMQKEGRTMFFFAKGSDMHSIVNGQDLRSSVGLSANFWNEPNVLRRLQRFKGLLKKDGLQVDITCEYPNGDKAIIEIPTSFPIKDNTMWNKHVYFVIGFTWLGPKAYDIRKNNPIDVPDVQQPMMMDHTVFPQERERKKISRPTHMKLEQELEEAETNLNHLKTYRHLSPKQEFERKQWLKTRMKVMSEMGKMFSNLKEF